MTIESRPNETESRPNETEPESQPEGDRALLVGELRSLGARAGATIARVGNPGNVILLRAARQFRGGHGNRYENDAKAALALLEESIGDLSEKQQTSAFCALGIRVKGESKARRYRSVLGDSYSKATADRTEKETWPLLADRIICNADNVSESASVARPPSRNTLKYLIKNYETYYRLAPGRRVQQALATMTIVSKETGYLDYDAHYVYFSDVGSVKLAIEPLFGCELVDTWTEHETRWFRLRTANPVRVGKEYKFSFLLTCKTAIEMESVLMVTPDADIDHATLGVEFVEQELPATIWRFSDLSYLRTRSVANRRNVFEVEECGKERVYQLSWSDMKEGMCFGFDWSWK